MEDKGGRPTKLTDKFFAAAEEVINGERALYLTDEDLLFIINEKLEQENKITHVTFENWKAGKISDDEKGKRFFGLIKKALTNEKINLFREMKQDTQWQRKAWILERKFKEWRLPSLHRHGGDEDNPTPISWEMVNYRGASAPVPVPATGISTPSV